jgi:molybdenum cofactor cytidylyltransferase
VTVAAAILSATPAGAVRDVDGRPLVRRLAEVAWAGGAVPVVVVAADPDGAVAAALAGASVTLAEPAPPEAGPVGQIVRAMEVAAGEVTETDATLVWPARMAWVDAETVTSLIEAHGTDAEPVLRPAYGGEAGWPALVPLAHLAAFRSLGRERMPDDLLADLERAGVPFRQVELGDPGVVHDVDTPREALPPYEGPPEPAGGHVHEWGSPAADVPDETPLEGPALAPYEQAARTE